MFQKRPSPPLPIFPKKKLQNEEDVRIDNPKMMEIGDVELIVDEDLGIKTELVDDEYNSQTNIVKNRPSNKRNIKIIEIDNDLKVDFVDTKKSRPNVCVRIDTQKIQGPSNVVNDASLLNRLAVYQKTLQSLYCAVCKVQSTLTMHIVSIQNGTFDISCSNCGLRIQNP